MDPLTSAMKVNPRRNHLVLWVVREAYVKWYVTGSSFVVLRRGLNGACFSFSILLGVFTSYFSVGYTNTYFLWNVALFMKSVWDCDTELSIYTHFAWF